jgi:hypothetical protein
MIDHLMLLSAIPTDCQHQNIKMKKKIQIEMENYNMQPLILWSKRKVMMWTIINLCKYSQDPGDLFTKFQLGGLIDFRIKSFLRFSSFIIPLFNAQSKTNIWRNFLDSRGSKAGGKLGTKILPGTEMKFVESFTQRKYEITLPAKERKSVSSFRKGWLLLGK